MKSIKLMADYQCHPLWDMSPGQYGDINPDDLPVSQGLKDRLSAWARAFDATLNMDYPPDSGFESEDAEAEFKREGYRLAEQLKDELGPGVTVTVHV
jgi:hypothetical protein